MTHRDALLAAAFGRFGPAEFTLADLAVAAWEADRRRWGLRGFELLYPDTKKVAVALMKRRDMAGLVEMIGRRGPHACRWRLTPAGLREAGRAAAC